MATPWKCVAKPSGNPSGPLHAARRTHYACRQRLTTLAGDNIDAPAACAIPFCPYCGGVVTRNRNVSEYMLVLTLCLVFICRSTCTVRSKINASLSIPTVVRYRRSYLSGSRCKWFAYGPDANDLHMVQLMPLHLIISCSSIIQNSLPFWCRLTQLVLEKRPLNRCGSSSCCCCCLLRQKLTIERF